MSALPEAGCDADVPGRPLVSRHLLPRIWPKEHLELKLLGLGLRFWF